MRFWDQWLRAWLIRYGGGLFGRLKAFVQARALEEAQQELEAGYRAAHRTGALWALLDLIGKRERIAPTEKALEELAQKNGLNLNVTDAAVLGRLEAQIKSAQERFPAALNGDDGNDTAVAARVAGFAVRWGAQQGVADAAEGSSAFTAEGIETDLLKRWIRLAARHEKRVWHDKLDGVTIGYNEKFRLETPRGVFLIDRPYDPKLPLSEKVGCGHAIQLVPPPGGSVLPWDGGAKLIPAKGASGGDGAPAAPRPRREQPFGEPVSSSITPVSNLPGGARVAQALQAIDRTHGGDLALPQIVVKAISRSQLNRLGGGTAAYEVFASGRPGSIYVRQDGGWKTLDFAHEVGHFLHQQAVGSPEQYPSVRQNARLLAWRDAVRQTPSVQAMRRSLEAGIGPDNVPLTDGQIESLGYLLEPQELFARSYAQYVAVTSADPTLLADVGLGRAAIGRVQLYNEQWQDEEFEEVARAFDFIFRDLRWIR